MSIFESIRQGLQEAIDFAEGKPVKAIFTAGRESGS